MNRTIGIALWVVTMGIISCNSTSNGTETATTSEPAEISNSASTSDLTADPDNGGLILPEGFGAVVVSEGVGKARHLTVNDNGDIYVNLRSKNSGGSIAALRDTTGDGKADVVKYFGNDPGTGIEIYNNYLYYSSNEQVKRVQLQNGQLVPDAQPEIVVTGLPPQTQHAAKAMAIDDKGNLFINIGAPSNNCMRQTRTKGSPGMRPCPQLDNQAGMWRFDANKLNQRHSDGEKYATGVRHAVAVAVNPVNNNLYIVQHGRDQLHEFFPDLYTVEDNAELPAEEFHMISRGDNLGWPYCYYDQRKGKKVMAPEYGGDGEKVGECGQYKNPLIGFPGHWAPNGMAFYNKNAFPQQYQNGVFIAFHGSWNRAPLEQQGYFVAFVPMDGNNVAGDYQRFADGFANDQTIKRPDDAKYRPMGLAVGPDGSLYVTDSNDGKIWRIFYKG